MPHDNLSIKGMLSLQTALRTKRQKAESVSQEYVLFAQLLWTWAEEHTRKHKSSYQDGRSGMPHLDGTDQQTGLWDCLIRTQGHLASSLDVDDGKRPDSRRVADRPFVRGEGVLQCRTSPAMHRERKHAGTNLEQYGCPQCTKVRLPKVRRAVLDKTKWSSLLQAVPPQCGNGIPARTPRQAEARS
jgi:hypothetical protein